jgi:hypothetical protein
LTPFLFREIKCPFNERVAGSYPKRKGGILMKQKNKITFNIGITTWIGAVVTIVTCALTTGIVKICTDKQSQDNFLRIVNDDDKTKASTTPKTVIGFNRDLES